MLIKTKYIDCASKSVFNTWKLPTSAADTSGDIYWSAVVYIKDTGEVWTHGKLYGGFFSNADNNKVSLTIGGTTKILALDGHVQSYTTLTGSGSTADQAILSTGEANKWTLKTLGKNAFSNVDYLPADATAVAAEKVVHALAFQYNGKAIHSFDGSVARVLNIIQGDNVFITGDSQGNVTIAADPGSDTVNTAGATNKVDTKLFLIGAESQTTAPQTYSNQYVYIGTDNCLYSLGKKVLTEHQAIYNLDLQTQVGEAVTKVTTFDPNAANNSFTLVQGTNVTLTPDAANKKVTISSKDTTYDFYNLVFKQGESVIDTYKPTTSPSKTLKAGTNVTFTGSNNEVLITTQDTRNTAGATEKLTTKLFLTGALTQTDNPQTYTNSKVYIGADNKLYSDGKVVSTGDHTHNYAGATSPGGPALKVDLNPSGLLDATYGSYGGILQDSNKGPVSGSWSNRIKILHNNSTGYYTELAQNFTGTAGLWHRRNVAGTISEWTPVIDNANFHTYLDSTYVIRGNDPNVLTNYVRYSINTGLTMNWEWGNATPTHIWGAKASDSSKAYVFNGDNIRAFANAVNRAGDTMTGTLKVTEIQATNGNGLVMWNGTTYTYLGMQAGTTYIRSGETDLQHRYNGTDYKIWDARNLVGLRTEHSHNTINFIDSRETASTPQEHAAGVWLDFKANAKANLSDGGNYTGLLTVRKYGGTTDWSGGKSAQLGFTDNSNVWVRFGTGTSWEAWKQLATTGWADGKFLPLAGGTMTGKLSWTMNGVTSSISNGNGLYTHHNTNASSGHWFNKNIHVAGNVYGGTSYNRILAFKDEINSQVGGSKSAQMNWASWGTDTYGGAIQIREQGLVTNKQSAWGYSPALTFHWGNRYAKRFGMRSDGQFAVDDVPISLSTHNHNSLYVTALGTNGNYLTWTKNGTTNNITVPYSANSDKLGGVHNGNVTANYYNVDGQQTLNLSSLDANKWYPCVMDAYPSNVTPIRVTFTDALSGHKPSWSTHSLGFSFQFDFEWVGGGWGAINWYLRVYRYAARFGGETACYGLEQRNNRSALVLYMRGGTSYYYRTTDGRSFTVYSTTTNIGDSTYPDNVSPRTSKLNDCYLQEASSRYGTCYRATYADNVTNADTVDGYHASGLFTNLSNSGNNISITVGGTNKTLTPAYATSAGSASYTHKVRGEYIGNGGQQNPNHFGTNWVGFRMMNTTVGTNSQYKDWIISDCYWGNDVGGAVAFGMNRQSLGAYLMGSDSNRSSWTRKGTFWGDWNLDPVTKSQLKKTRVPGEVVDFYVYQVNGYTCTSTDYTTFRNQLFDSSGRGKSSVSYKATYSSMTYTVNLSDFVLACNEISTYSNGMYTAGGGEIESNRIGSTAGANSKTITGYEMPKHAHWFGRHRSDNANDRDVFGPDGGQNHSTNGTTSAGQGGNWRTGYSGNGQSKDWRPKTIFVFKMVYAPQSW